ncbi:MAG TPA: alpha/beta fold hydrolase, partial [Thermoanaerobaculia bacterium]|nr:alpha/beta fold hydrolase [Thermoanaerobaculia bacterium]
MKKSYEFLFSAFCVLLNFGCARTPALSPAISPGKTGTVVFKPPGYLRGDRNTHAKRVIIFIHGVFGDGTSTWQNHASGAYFPALVAADETFAGADIWVHQFDTPKLRQSYTIDELADHLRRYLNNDNVVANHDEIIFVAHSMGGLVARAYLLKYREMPPERVRMMYFFSTPTTGSDVASLARLISDNPQLSDMRKMTTDDAGVLGVWEAQWSSSPYAKTTLSYCAYELLPTMGTIVVQRESARHLCNTRPDPIARNHIDIVKPRDGDDESYVAFRQAYRDTFEQHASTPVWNLLRQDRSLLQVRNVTQTPYCEYSCWSDAVIVAPGDVVRFAAYYHNVGIVTAKDARLSIR